MLKRRKKDKDQTTHLLKLKETDPPLYTHLRTDGDMSYTHQKDHQKRGVDLPLKLHRETEEWWLMEHQTRDFGSRQKERGVTSLAIASPQRRDMGFPEKKRGVDSPWSVHWRDEKDGCRSGWRAM